MVGLTVQYAAVGLMRSTTITCSMLEKVLMTLGEVDLGIGQALLPPIIQAILVDHQVYSCGNNRSRHISHTSQFYAYNHGGINIAHPRFPQGDIPSDVYGENLHQNLSYY